VNTVRQMFAREFLPRGLSHGGQNGFFGVEEGTGRFAQYQWSRFLEEGPLTRFSPWQG
jgi:hypothetical protein